MGEQLQSDRRRHIRYPMATGVEFYHGPSRRKFPARSADVSRGGMLMFVPASTPVSPGQPIRVAVNRYTRAEFRELTREPVDATIVRVDRGGMLDGGGHLPVGVRFTKPMA